MKTHSIYCALGLLIAGASAQENEKKDMNFSFAGVPEGAAGYQVVQSPAKVKKISLFKNGYGFYNMTVAIPEDSPKNVAITPTGLPDASHGTLWPDEASREMISHILSHKNKKQVSRNNFSLLELAQANPGAKVRIRTEKGDVMEGTVSELTLSGEKPSTDPSSSISENHYDPIQLAQTPQSSPFLTIKKDDSLAILSPTDIRQIEFLEQTSLKTPTLTEDSPQMDIYLKETRKNTEIGLSCVSKGITWVPSYQIDISEPGNAKFQGNAIVINELMDIDQAEMELITGFPSLQFASIPSPICMKQSMSQFFQFLPRLNDGSDMGSITMYNVAVQSRFKSESSSSMDEDPGRMLKNIQSEDLFFYPVKRFSCKKNETVTLPLFSGKVPYTHLYTWDIPLDNARPWERSSNREDLEDDIWHCLKITNALPLPLTTAPIEFVSRGRIVGQSTLTFTASGENAKVKINKSMEFTTEKVEKVTGQTPKQDILDYRYVEFAIQGELLVTNLNDKAITMEITKNIQGQNIQTPDGGVVTHGVNYGYAYNLNGSIKWTVEIQPKEKKKVSYTYLYIQR